MPNLTRERIADLRRLLAAARELDEAVNPMERPPSDRTDGRLDPWEVGRFHALCKMACDADDALHAELNYDTIAALLDAAERDHAE